MATKDKPKDLTRTTRKDLARSEVALLDSLLANRRTYRHHLWFRHCRLALHRCKKGLAQPSHVAVSSTLRCLERAAAECVSEARLVRVDTVGLTTGLLAVMSRLHLLFSVAERDLDAGGVVLGGALKLDKTRRRRRAATSDARVGFREALQREEIDDE